jgi:hypothetical protein
MAIEYRYFVVRMEVEVDEDGLLDAEYNRVERAETQLQDLVGHAHVRKARGRTNLADHFIN